MTFTEKRGFYWASRQNLADITVNLFNTDGHATVLSTGSICLVGAKKLTDNGSTLPICFMTKFIMKK